MSYRLALLVLVVVDRRDAQALALKRRMIGGTPKKKKRVKKAPPPPRPPMPPPAPQATPSEAHLGAVRAAVGACAPALTAALEDSYFVGRGFLGAAPVAAMLAEARAMDSDLVPSRSTRWNGTATVAFDKAGVRSAQILGGADYDRAPRLTEYVVSLTAALSEAVNAHRGSLRKLSTQKQTNKLAVCDAVGAAYPKHVDNGGGGDPRLLTAILYLSGCPAGGAFRAYAPDSDAVAEVAPEAGTLLVFWADRLVHDVSAVSECGGPADARWALTVWLCADDVGVVEATPGAVLARHFPDAAS